MLTLFNTLGLETVIEIKTFNYNFTILQLKSETNKRNDLDLNKNKPPCNILQYYLLIRSPSRDD